ncbi:MAG: hypothetical protein COB67_03170 [SAR324 cluster bacterium]|uniref:DSBA-like thioredoxin domain-containing protein n=1 Tax=SAR324 cluster bacterium TaxID=2024889 RepID=A0A2A4T9A5_9DELT|nr:MAG: hypothetical protein COB67_03170 [SAR324 cluster bacterium]
MKKLSIDIMFDTVCPWCWIGKKNLSNALSQLDNTEVTISHHPFILNETIPEQGVNLATYLSERYGQDFQTIFAGPIQAGKAVGLNFNLKETMLYPNSILSHKLIKLTQGAGKEAMIEDLYQSYFEAGLDIGKVDVLLKIAEKHGLNREKVEAFLANQEAEDSILERSRQTRELGVSSVPTICLNDKILISANQPDLLAQLQKAAAE